MRHRDLRDALSLETRRGGCGLVFHVAATTGCGPGIPRSLYRSNVDGTRNLLSAAKKRRRRARGLHQYRGLHGFRMAESGMRRRRLARRHDWNYKRSKFLAEQVALEFARGGFPVVIVNPTAPVGIMT